MLIVMSFSDSHHEKLRGQPFNINIIRVYTPTADKSEDKIKEFYDHIKKVLKYTKKNELIIIMGDFNAKVGNGKKDNIVSKHDLGERNERGDRLVQFCREDFIISNT